MRHLAKFSGDRSNRCTDMPIFRFVKMTAVWHVEVETFEILSAEKVKRIILRHRTKFLGDLSNRCLVMAI